MLIVFTVITFFLLFLQATHGGDCAFLLHLAIVFVVVLSIIGRRHHDKENTTFNDALAPLTKSFINSSKARQQTKSTLNSVYNTKQDVDMVAYKQTVRERQRHQHPKYLLPFLRFSRLSSSLGRWLSSEQTSHPPVLSSHDNHRK